MTSRRDRFAAVLVIFQSDAVRSKWEHWSTLRKHFNPFHSQPMTLAAWLHYRYDIECYTSIYFFMFVILIYWGVAAAFTFYYNYIHPFSFLCLERSSRIDVTNVMKFSRNWNEVDIVYVRPNQLKRARHWSKKRLSRRKKAEADEKEADWRKIGKRSTICNNYALSNCDVSIELHV